MQQHIPLYVPIQRLYGATHPSDVPPVRNASTAPPISLLPFHATPIPSHFPSYTQIHPLSAEDDDSLYSKHVQALTKKPLDVLDLARDDITVMNEMMNSTMGDPFESFGIWPRSRFASFRHIVIDHGWLLMELDSVAQHELEFHVGFVQTRGPEQQELKQLLRNQQRYQPGTADFHTLSHNLHVGKSVFLWMYFPLPGTWKVTIYIKKKSAENFTPCFQYEINVRRTWDYHVGGFCPSLFQNTRMHFDDRVQVLEPLQHYLEQGSHATFKVLLNTQLFSHVGILMSRQQFPKKIFFLDPQHIGAHNGKKNVSSSPMQLFTGDISVDFFQGAEMSNEAPLVHILLFEHSDKHLRNPITVATYTVQVDIQRLPSNWILEDSQLTASDIISSGPKDSMETLFSMYDKAGTDINSIGMAAGNNQRSSSPIKTILEKKSKYSQLARFWTNDLHLFQPKSRFLRSGERTRFKVRIAGAHKVVVRVGKRAYAVEKVPSLFQSIKGSDNRMELFESNIVFKDPEHGKLTVVNLYYYTTEKERNGKHKKVPIAQFVLQPNPDKKKLEIAIAALSEAENDNSHSEAAPPTMAPPAPDHRPLATISQFKEAARGKQRKGDSILPNLRPATSFTNSQIVYTVDVSKSLPTTIARKVLKQLPFLKVPKQMESTEFFKESKKPERTEQLNEYWQQLNETQKRDRLNEDTLISGVKTSDQLGGNIFSTAHTRNELAGVLLKNPLLEELISKQSRYSKYMEANAAASFTPPPLAFSSDTKRFHKTAQSADHSLDDPETNPLMQTGVLAANHLMQQLSKSRGPQSASQHVSQLKKAEQAMYASTGTNGTFTVDSRRRTESRTDQMRRQKMLNEKRKQMHLQSKQQQRKQHEQHTTINDIVDRVRGLMDEEDIHNLAKEIEDVQLHFFETSKQENLKRSKNPSRKPYQVLKEKHTKKHKAKPTKKEEVVFVQPLAVSPRKIPGGVHTATISSTGGNALNSAITKLSKKKREIPAESRFYTDDILTDEGVWEEEQFTRNNDDPQQSSNNMKTVDVSAASQQQSQIKKPKRRKERQLQSSLDVSHQTRLSSPVAPLHPSSEEDFALGMLPEHEHADKTDNHHLSAHSPPSAGPLVEYTKQKVEKKYHNLSTTSSGATTKRKSQKRSPKRANSVSPTKTKNEAILPVDPVPHSIFTPEPEDLVSKEEKVKELKRKLKEEKKKAQEKRDKAMAKKAERAQRLKAQQKAEELKKKEHAKNTQQKKQQAIARKKEEALLKQAERAEQLKQQRQQEKLRQKQEQEKMMEKRKQDQAEAARAARKLKKKRKKAPPQGTNMAYCQYITVVHGSIKGKCSWMPSVCPLSATDVRVALNLSGTQSLFLSIVGLKHPDTGEVFEFQTESHSIFPELPVETPLDVNVNYQVIIEDKRNSDVSSLSQEEIDEIRTLFDKIDKNGNGEIDEEELRVWYEDIERQKLREQNEYFDSLVLAHPEMSEEIENRRKAAKQQSKKRVSYNVRAYQESDIDGDRLISFEEFLAHEARKKRVRGG
mmetsp:Transcript_8517/g.31510  ORF Transcript_8517/g.31510 Transcript_8517/m.31510 type:complete len:1525 (-) Transcript_8517:4632-9206(-)|eukprot:CAMPEP_0117439678 /NCGR_PEP_ID=MMETSP0759-20121206/2687_1 /TAXON_ID=63605 /ORGANISM="Percolomonas cosmopolitus, Strain WS" /LENGTH=1524 /DNA_ID=CAMNT_0005231397 /DNA_START=222 /DNA_END=4796 /DNA_ORIENTATION=+